ncbi:MAG: threonylcarbamoyl-AMP synthase [Chlorobiaceae bacterium]|nr:threonylcarbamoyl-AMP synthase [Chlorobiaceae bacterium]NTV61722.1 threonylcarbamoyl-AMP synthase [Chlorobiaceae bacterium]
MQTILTESPETAAGFLNRGEVVAFPTETVYGLGAAICHPEAVKKIFLAKGRPSDNPLIVHIRGKEDLPSVAGEISGFARKLIDRFFPGPLTLVFRKNPDVPDSVTAGLDTVGVRCPSHPVAQEFLRLACCPVAAPSANISGLPSATSWETVHRDLDGRISCILKGGPSDIGLESTIVDCSGQLPLLLRAGAITLEQLREVVPETRLAAPPDKKEPPKSPGLKYPHYAPSAAIVPCAPEESVPAVPCSAYIGIGEAPPGVEKAKLCRDLREYARELFSFFRQCDDQNIRVIYCELPENHGLGRAIRDRILRAAGSYQC